MKRRKRAPSPRRPPRGAGAKGARRMPRHGAPKKGAGSRDSPGGAALRLRSRGARMGEPDRRGPVTRDERGATGGTETSKYPEEGKSTETAGVEAIGTAPAQTGGRVTACARCAAGVEGARSRGRTPRGGVTKRQASGRTWEGPPQRVRAPYAEPAASPRAAPSTAGHEEPGGKQGGPPSKAKHVPVTDSGRVP